MSRIGNSFKNFRDRMRANINIKSQNFVFFLALLLIAILAFVIRISPILRGGQLIKAFDPWIQYYNAEYLNTHSLYEYFHWRDYKSWYPTGIARYNLNPGLPFTVVVIYKIIEFLGIPLSLYDLCYFFPAFMGSVSVIAMYFLGKEIKNRSCGLVAAFFMAFSVGFMSRTMAGFFDNETIGVFATIMTLLYFLKAIRTGKISFSIIGGIFLGYLSFSWGGYLYTLLLIPLIVVIIILTNKYTVNVLIAYAGVIGTSYLVSSLFISYVHNDLVSDMVTGSVFLFIILLIMFHFIYTKKSENPKLYDTLLNLLKWGLVPVALIVAVIIWVAPDLIPFGIGSKFMTILSPLFRDSVALIASVAEHIPSPWSSFYYNTLVPLMLIPLGVYFCFKRSNIADILLVVVTLTLFYFTGSMIRIILIFAPAASLMGAYGLVNVLEIFGGFVGERKASTGRKRRRQVKKTVGNSEVTAVYLIVGFICMAQVFHSVDASINQLSYGSIVTGGVFHDWEESLSWMKNNLDGTDVVVSWWDYGYWLTPIGNVTTVNDNNNLNSKVNGMTGMGFMQTDELASARAFQKLGADYVLVYFTFLVTNLGGDEGKWQWMLRICNDNYEYYKKIGMEEDNWKDNAVFDEDDYTTPAGVKKDSWFDSQLAKLMFWGIPTEAGYPSGSLLGIYNDRIESWSDDDGDSWSSHIPPNGAYESNIFIPIYMGSTGLISSSNGLVKLYKVDYTVLESNFEIQNPKVYDSGYGTFTLKNTGTRDLTIKNVTINGQDHDFAMGKGIQSNSLEAGDEDLVWVDFSQGTYDLNDVVSIEVTAEADGLLNKVDITNSTSNFFVSEAEEGDIKINRENSRVILRGPNEDFVDIYLEVENTGSSVTTLDTYYANSVTNAFDDISIEYLSGSSILDSGEIAHVKIANVPSSKVEFFTSSPRNYVENMIGVMTPNGINDEVLFSSSYENYNISIHDIERIISPEILASTSDAYRYHIPVDLSETHAYSYDNDTSRIYVKVQNTGQQPINYQSVFITLDDSWSYVDPNDWWVASGSISLDPGGEDTVIINIDESNYFDIDVNDELGLKIIGSIGDDPYIAASDVGYIHTVYNQSSIEIIDIVDSDIADISSVSTSNFYANESGRLLIKNTGNEIIQLNESGISINGTLASSVEFIYGSSTLGIQECAIITFNINDTLLDLDATQATSILVNVTTNSSLAYDAIILDVNYNIEIDETASNASANPSGYLNITVINHGLLNTTINAVYINDTYINLGNFSSVILEIDHLGGNVTLSMSMDEVEAWLGGIVINAGSKLKIFIGTQEEAEDEFIIDVDP